MTTPTPQPQPEPPAQPAAQAQPAPAAASSPTPPAPQTGGPGLPPGPNPGGAAGPFPGAAAGPYPGQPAGPIPGAAQPGAGLPPGAPAGILDATERRALAGVAKWWWLFIVTGVIWILLALVILQFSFVSVVAVGYIVGFMLLATGVEEIFIASATERLKWLWYIVGIILVLGGLWSIFNPGRTATWLALSIGVLFGLIGLLWIIEGVVSRGVNSAWVLGVVAGVLMIALAFWAAGQTTAGRMLTLLTVAGIWSIMHGIGDIIRAVQLKRLGSLVSRGGI